MDLTFIELLQKRNASLFAQLEEIRRRAFEEWIHLLKPDQGSHAGYVHLRNVSRNADKMIPADAKKAFGDGEIFLLLVSILLHDLGRIIPDKYYRLNRDERRSQKKPEPCPESSGDCLDGARRFKEQGTHACKSRDLIEKHWAIFGVPDEQIARLIGLLAFWHQFDTPPADPGTCATLKTTKKDFSEISLEPYGRIRMPLLASILRIADETEDTWTRAIRTHWYEKFHADGRIADLGKAFRRRIADVEFFPAEGCIVLHIPEGLDPEALGPKIKLSRPNEIREVVRAWGSHIGEAGARYKYVFVSRGGIPYAELGPVKGDSEIEEHLRNVFSWPALTETNAGGAAAGTGDQRQTQEPLLRQGSMGRYFKAIERLALGTRRYEQFTWSAMEGAIGEPLTPEKKWAIQWAGRVHPRLQIVTHPGPETVEIRVLRQGPEK